MVVAGTYGGMSNSKHIQLKKENDVGKRLDIFAGLASEYEDTRRKQFVQKAKKLLSGSQTE